MTDAFSRPTTSVVQSARPCFAKMISIIRVSDEVRRLRPQNPVAIKIRHHLVRIAAYYSAKRSALTDTISIEYAYKISVALLNAPREQHDAIVSALTAEKEIKIKSSCADIEREQEKARVLTVQHIQQHNKVSRSKKTKPIRPMPKNSLRFSALRR